MSESDLDLASLVQLRGRVRAKLTRESTLVDENIQDFNVQQCAMHIEKCKNIRSEIIDYDKRIFALKSSVAAPDTLLSKEALEEEQYEDKISMTISQLLIFERDLTLASNINNERSNNDGPARISLAQNNLKLPHVPLPEFSNKKGDNIQKFFRSFEAMIDKHKLTGFEKYMFLRKQLSDAPKNLIESLDVDQQSYVNAKQLLLQAFDSTEQSKFEIIKMLAELQLRIGGDPYNFIGEMKTVISGMKSLNITVDDIIGYFAWKGLNSNFQNHLTSITNKCKPNLDEINASIFEATQRYLKQIDEQKHSKFENAKFSSNFKPNKYESNSSVNAVNLNSDKAKVFPCILCQNEKKSTDHVMKDCPVFETARKKFNKLRELKACTKCSFRNHETSSCQFNFKSTCRNCNGSHMTFLCLKEGNKSSLYNKDKPKNSSVNVVQNESNQINNVGMDVINNVLFVEASQLATSSPMILPTMTAYLCGKNFEGPVRVFKDGGCQQTFICAAVADSYNLKIIDENVSLTIHGFNSSRKLNTKLVQLKIKIGSKVFDHEAICIDTISTKFCADGIHDVISGFKEKGYTIADKGLEKNERNVVGDIDLILGTDADHMIQMKYEAFGDTSSPNTMSSFISTPVGVVLSGNLNKMQSNLKYLPDIYAGKTSVVYSTGISTPIMPIQCKDTITKDTITNDTITNEPSRNWDMEYANRDTVVLASARDAVPSSREVDSGEAVSREVNSAELTSRGTVSNGSISREVCSLGSGSREADTCGPVSREVHPVGPPSREACSHEFVSRGADSDTVVSQGNETFEAISCETALRKINSNSHLLSSENNYHNNNSNKNDDCIELDSNQCFNILINNNDDDICFMNEKLPQIKFSDDEVWLDSELDEILSVSKDLSDDRVDTETNAKLIDFVLSNTSYDEEGRLTMPLTWNSKNAHLLSKNYNLAYKVLQSNIAKLKTNPQKMKMYNEVFKEQASLKIIERIENLPKFLEEHPEASFLSHMGVFRMSNESTKCRVVFLSNMHEKKGHGISHNMAMLPGPNLNHKIATAVLMHRFDKYMLIFDIQKAFLNINLYECDRNRLCFLWFQNVERNDFTVVGFRNLRLSFGLRPSPFLLMAGLYKILMLDNCERESLRNFKKAIYNCIYMDNGSYSCNSEEKLNEAYKTLDEIFSPYNFKLQQYATNFSALQTKIDDENKVDTVNEVKFFGLIWNRDTDTLKPNKIELDMTANTKRKVLSSLNAVY